MKGYFITVEGVEGAGKTTILEILFQQLTEKGYDVIITREPGGIRISEKIRDIILDQEHVEMDERTEALLYAAARRQHLIQKIIPALEDGKIVLCDRFIDSSLAYQGHARGIGMDHVLQINNFAIEGLMPSLTLYFDIQPEKGLQRIVQNKHRELNRLDLETLEFHEKVYEAYQQLLYTFPERIKRIDADREIETVAQEALQSIISHVRG